MPKSRSRLAADWFAKLRLNAQNELEHTDLVALETASTSTDSTKADATTVYTKQEVEAKIVELAPATDISGKADTTYVDTNLATKADTTTMNTALAAKADTTAMNTALAAKADTTYVDSEIAGIDLSPYLTATDYAASTTGGTVKMRVSGTTLYITNNGTNA